MDFTTLRYYICICETGSLTKAADKLFISRQGITKAVRKMEEELGVKLLMTHPRGIELTGEGRCLYENARRILEDWDRTVRQIRNIGQEKPVVLHIGYGYMSYNLWKVDHVERFMQFHPNIRVEPETMPPDQLLDALADRRIDAAVTSAHTSDLRFTMETLVHRPFYVLMRRDDPLAERETVRFSDLAGRNLCFLPGYRNLYQEIRALAEEQNLQVNCLYSPSMELTTVLRLIEASSGLYFTSAIFSPILPDGFLLKPFDNRGHYEIFNKDIQAITLRDSRSQPVQTYLRYLRQEQKMARTP